MSHRIPGRLAAALLLVATPLLHGCDDLPASGDVLDRETFIETYVDLRHAALASPDGEIDAAARDSVLALHGVTEEELLAFAEAHGRDVDYVREIWTEVESRLDDIQLDPEEEPDTAPGPGPDTVDGGDTPR